MVTFMCPNTDTADRFYVLSLNMVQSREMHHHFEEAMAISSTPAPGVTSGKRKDNSQVRV